MPLAVVTEDEWLIRLEVADVLLAANWEVQECASGEQALAFLEQRRDVALLVTDIRLGGAVTGWDVAEAYRGRNPRLKVIYCSGNVPDLARQVPGSQFLAKPCPMEVIRRAAMSL